MPPRKDPNKPKGRTSAYAFFVKARRAFYKSKNEDVNFTEFSRECSDLWKEVKDGEKEKFVRQAEDDRRRYDKEMEKYVPPEGASGKKGKRRRNKKEKDPNQPKRAMSAFMWFLKEKRPEFKEQHPGATVGQIAKQLGAEWKELSEEEKAPFVQLQKKDRDRYEKELSDYQKQGARATAGDDEDEEEEEEYSDED